MALVKKTSRLRRARKARYRIRDLGITRLCVNRTPRHIYAQILSYEDGLVLACASTLEKGYRTENPSGGNIPAAAMIGKLIAERALAVGVSEVAFDRSGFKYHGRIKALADAARENGLKF